jgi:lipopolysaccharide cholinephosphotransferase
MTNALPIEYVQEILLDQLRDVSTFAADNNLKIFLLGGSLLGNVRDGGMLPWDDDLDVGLKRADYDWLMENYIPRNSRFELWKEQDERNNVPYMRLVDTQTIGRSEYLTQKHGISLDIFPIDEIGKNAQSIKWFFGTQKGMKILRNIANSTGRYPADTKLRLIKEGIRKATPFLSASKLAKRQLKATEHMIQTSGTPSKVGVLQGVYGQKELFPETVWQTYEKTTFENIPVWQIKQIDVYLTQFFGDWRTPSKAFNKHGAFYMRESD